MKKGIQKYLDYYNDKTTILRFASMSLVFVLVILLGFGARFYLATSFDAEDFWGDLGFSMALCIYCMFLGIPEAKDAYRKKVDGRYQKAMTDFAEIRKSVLPEDERFDAWLDQFYLDQRLDYFKQLLTVKGINNYKVLDLGIDELPNLAVAYEKEWEDGSKTKFKAMTEEQIKLVSDILTGKIKVKKIPNDAFKTANGKIISNEYVTQSKRDGRNSMTYALLVAGRLLLMIVISVFLVLFGIKMSESSTGEEILNQVIDTLGRIWTMLSSYMYGFSIGRMMVTNECDQIEFKTRVNHRFLNDKGFQIPEEQTIIES